MTCDASGILHLACLRSRVTSSRWDSVLEPVGTLWATWVCTGSQLRQLQAPSIFTGRTYPRFLIENSGSTWLLTRGGHSIHAWRRSEPDEQPNLHLVDDRGEPVSSLGPLALRLQDGTVLLAVKPDRMGAGLLLYRVPGISDLKSRNVSPTWKIAQPYGILEEIVQESDELLWILQRDSPLNGNSKSRVLGCSVSLPPATTPQHEILDVQYPLRQRKGIPGQRSVVFPPCDGPILIARNGRKFVIWVGIASGEAGSDVVCAREVVAGQTEEIALSEASPEGTLSMPSAAVLPDGTVTVSWLRHRSGLTWDLMCRDVSSQTGGLGSLVSLGSWDLASLDSQRASLSFDGQAHTTVCGSRDGRTGVWLVPLPTRR